MHARDYCPWLVLVVALAGLVAGCWSVSPANERVCEPFVANQVAQLQKWLETRSWRMKERYETPEGSAVRFAFSDTTTNGTFGAIVYFETNLLNVAVADGMNAGAKAREFDHFFALVNQGRKFWVWKRDRESNDLFVQCTVVDFGNVGQAQPGFVPALVGMGEDEVRNIASVMRRLKNGELAPAEAYQACPKTEVTPVIVFANDGQKIKLAETYQALCDALRDKLPIRWEKELRFPIRFDLGISSDATRSASSTNMIGLIRTDCNLVECVLMRPWGVGDKLEKLAPLAVKCNQMRGDGRWACIEDGEFCIRGSYPLPYVLADPGRFVKEFVLASSGELLTQEDEMLRVVPEGAVRPEK